MVLIRSVEYNDEHDCSTFDCGEPSLNVWVQSYAAHAHAMRTANTYVWERKRVDAPPQVLGYYALAGHMIIKHDLPASLAKGGPETVPAVLLAKMGLDRALQGSGLGGALLLDALARVLGAAATGPAVRVMVVDAIDDKAASFYEHHGFVPIRNSTRKLVIAMSKAEKAIGAMAGSRPT